VIIYTSKQNNEKVHSISESAILLLKIIVAENSNPVKRQNEKSL